MNPAASTLHATMLACALGAPVLFATFAVSGARADASITTNQQLDFGPTLLSTKTSPNIQPTVPLEFQKFNVPSGQLTQVTWTYSGNPEDLALFTGQGSGQLSVFMRAVEGTNFDNGLRDFDAQGKGTFTSTLTYTPEPAGPTMLSAGLLLAFGLKRFRSRNDGAAPHSLPAN
jgi:hypothetical protein